MKKTLEIVKQQIDTLLEEQTFVIVAIDGKCTSGKTTLASQLAEIYDCNVFHMDDFSSERSSEHRNGLLKQAAM